VSGDDLVHKLLPDTNTPDTRKNGFETSHY